MGGDPNPERPRVVAEWKAVFGSPPPKFLSVGFMEKAIAYETQCKTLGGLPAKTRRALVQIAKGKTVQSAQAGSVKAGAHLLREWNGRSYQVEVVESGFRMDGRDWKSLSAIAKHITGATWSGPRFFGLTSAGGRAS
jgi:hypothetical protein